MSKQIVAIDRSSISKFQKEMYLPDPKKEIILPDGRKIKETVDTRFSMEIVKRAQANHIKMKLDQVPVKEGEIIYKASKKFDVLNKISAHITLPPVKVLEQYKKAVQIAYHHNLGHNILYEGECKVDNEHYGYLDSVYLDAHSQYLNDEKKRKLYDQMIGNLPCLEEWNTELPGVPLIIHQPFSFSRNTRVGLPILKSSNNDITFEYKVRRKLSDLLKMKVLIREDKDTGEKIYKEYTKCNPKYIDVQEIDYPEIFGRYSEITDEERNWRKSIDEETQEPRKQTIYIEDIDKISSENPKAIGTKESIPLSSTAPAKHIFWMAGLIDSGLSNYTTDKSDPYKGWNPCAKSGIKYGNSDRIEELGHEHFDLSEAYDYNWPTVPRESGYNVHTYTFNPSEIQSADTAVVLKDSTLNVVLADTNPFLKKDDDEDQYDDDGQVIPAEVLENRMDESKKDKYIVHVRIVVMRKLEVYWNEKTSSLKYIFTSL